MRTRRTKAGFTLVELMIVVTIIGVGTALSAAGVGDTFSEMRASRAALELVRIGRRAKSEASGYMRAYLVWIQPQANRVSLIRGRGWSCTNEDWNAQFTVAPGCGSAASPCIEQVDFAGGNYTSDPFPVQLDYVQQPGPNFVRADTALCYAPSGRMFSAQNTSLAAAPAAFSSLNVASGGFLFAVRRMESDGSTVHGVTRWVLFPQGAPARVLR